MSRLTPGLITLDKGLDLNTAKIAAPEGTLLDSLNYEQVDFMGQKRIDGYARYDGSQGSYQDTLYVVQPAEWPEDVAMWIGEPVFNADNNLVGTITGTTPIFLGNLVLSIINNNLIPSVGDLMLVGDSALTVESIMELKDFVRDNMAPEAPEYESYQYDLLLDANENIRRRTTELPGPVAGLHWFEDRLYAVASVLRLELSSASHGIMPNDTYQGLPVLKVDGPYVYVGGLGAPDPVVGSDMASFFQSRTEDQALTELGDANLYGWEFVHLGWEVPFKEGVSLYGGLAALNQNRAGVGVQGPTSIAGNSGRPLSVTQKVDITNLPIQVNGWKSSTSRTTYNLDVGALSTVDNWTLYADAFFSWDGATGVITTTGINSGTLAEYSPNATVEVEV